MKKAFIFDLDGVLIDNEQIWEDKKQIMFKELLGSEVAKRLGPTIGINLDGVYERAVKVGSTITKQKLVDAFFALSDDIYKTAPISEGLQELARQLVALDYRIGIVSASPLSWIITTTKRLSFEADIEVIISLYERPDLAHKPAPDGYLEAMRVLGAPPATTIILEDSNTGIQSAKASGALAVGLKQNLLPGYVQLGADVYAETFDHVVQIVKAHSENLQ